MKKSKMYQLAEIAVVNSNHITTPDKLDILRLLFEKEECALLVEAMEEETEKEKQTPKE